MLYRYRYKNYFISAKRGSDGVVTFTVKYRGICVFRLCDIITDKSLKNKTFMTSYFDVNLRNVVISDRYVLF